MCTSAIDFTYFLRPSSGSHKSNSRPDRMPHCPQGVRPPSQHVLQAENDMSNACTRINVSFLR